MTNYLSSRAFEAVSVGAGAGAAKTKILNNGDTLDCTKCIDSLVIIEKDATVTVENLVPGAVINLFFKGKATIGPGSGITIEQPGSELDYFQVDNVNVSLGLLVVDTNNSVIITELI